MPGKNLLDWFQKIARYRLVHEKVLSDLRNTIQDLRSEPISLGGGSRAGALFAHSMPNGFPDVSVGENSVYSTDADLFICERILAAYHRTVKEDPESRSRSQKRDTWNDIKDSKFGALISMLDQNEPKGLLEYLTNYGRKYISFGGLSQGFDGYSLNDDRQRAASLYLDKLVCFAEALGVMSTENPEQKRGRWGKNIYTDVAALIDKIEQRIRISIIPPQTSIPMVGIQTDKGLVHYRNINSLYCSWKIRQILDGTVNPSVCEIGGGFGGVALYCNRFDITDYTIFDLPLTNIISSFYLIKSLPHADIVLYDESNENKAAIKIYPHWLINQIPDGSYSLIVNQDSFPEIERSTVLSYLQNIRRLAMDYFLSINQEGERQTKEDTARRELNISLMLMKHDGFERIQRNRCWVREGYVDELYKVSR